MMSLAVLNPRACQNFHMNVYGWLLFVFAWTGCYCYADSHAIDWWWFWWTWISHPAAVKLPVLSRILIECCISVLLFRCAWAYCFIAMFACHEVWFCLDDECCLYAVVCLDVDEYMVPLLPKPGFSRNHVLVEIGYCYCSCCMKYVNTLLLCAGSNHVIWCCGCLLENSMSHAVTIWLKYQLMIAWWWCLLPCLFVCLWFHFDQSWNWMMKHCSLKPCS